MALSNIFREPRREITESVVGTLVIVPFVVLDYFLACAIDKALPGGPPLGFIMVLTALGLLAALGLGVIFLLVIPHAIGEGVCGFMARRGFEVRPKNRPVKR